MTTFEGPTSPTLRLKQAERVLRRHLAPALQAEAVTFEQWQVLAVLLEHPGLRMSDVAEVAALPRATLTRHVDHLVESALVVRRIDPADKRRAVLALSRLGEQAAHRLHGVESELVSTLDFPVLASSSSP